MRKLSVFKRIGAVLLALSLLCGMVLTSTVLPVSAATDWDYAHVMSEPFEAWNLDGDFVGYQFSAPKDNAGTAALGGPFKPSATDTAYTASTRAYWTTAYHGLHNKGALKPTTIPTNGYAALTYKTAAMKDFELELVLTGSYEGVQHGLIFGGDLGVMPVSADGDNTNDTGVMITITNGQTLRFGGAIDPTSVSGDSISHFPNMVADWKDASASKAGVAVESNISDAYLFTFHLKVENGVMTAWLNDETDLKATAKLSDNYKGGYVTYANGGSGAQAALWGFKIKKLSDVEKEEEWDYEHTMSTTYEYWTLENDFNAYWFAKPATTAQVIPAKGPYNPNVRDYGYTASTRDYWCTRYYGSHNNGLLKATTYSGQWAVLTYKVETMKDFEMEFTIPDSYARQGIIFGGDLGVMPVSGDSDIDNDTGVILAYENMQFFAGGAIATDTANHNDLPNMNVAKLAVTERTFSMGLNAEVKDATLHTYRVRVENGVLTMWAKGEENLAKSITLSDKYVGGYVSFFTVSDQCGLYSFKIKKLSNAKRPEWDYAHTMTAKNQAWKLDAHFRAYEFTIPASGTSPAAVGGPWSPSESVAYSDTVSKPRWLTENWGDYNKGWLKPVFGTGYQVLTYNTKRYENFEVEFSVSASYTRQGIIFGAEPGDLGVTLDKDNTNDTGVLVAVESSKKLAFAGAVDTSSWDGTTSYGEYPNTAVVYATVSADNANNVGSNTEVNTFRIRVVDKVVTVWDVDEPELAKTFKLNDNYEGGYISYFARENKHNGLVSFKIKEIVADENANIPTKVTFNGTNLLGFNTTYANKYPNNKDNVTYDDPSITDAQRTEFINALNGAFDVFYNDYDGANAVYTKNGSVVGNTVGYNYAKLQYYNAHAWLRPVLITGYDATIGAALRQVGSLVPKDGDGDRLNLKNFDLKTSFAFWTGSTGNGAILIGFRQEQPGRYFTASGGAAKGSYLMISNDKLQVYENGTLLHEATFSAANQGQVRNLNVKVVGKQLTYKVFWNTTTILTDTVQLTSESTGYLALSNTHYLRSFSATDFSVTALDDYGDETPIKKPNGDLENGTVTVTSTTADGVVTNTITVTPDEGYELLAGSLVATDLEGNTYVPTRVGFRETGDADRYEVKAPSLVTVTATFYKPTSADPNMGNIGTSINESVSGLRFVSRLARTEKDGVEYVTFDGKSYAVSDYGMLVATEAALGSDTLSLELSEANVYIKKLSVMEKGVYYDMCDAYVDMSVCITGVDRVEGGTDMNVVARPYAIAKDEQGDDVILYASTFTSNYAQNAGLTTVTFSELQKEDKVEIIGRAGVVGDDLQMDWVNTGFEIKGNLTGNVKVTMNSAREDSLLNVSVDGQDPTIVHVAKGTTTVTLAKNLSKGEHTIRVESGTSVTQGTLDAKTLQFLGTLNTNVEEQSRLKIEVLGDSISCGWGLDGNNSMALSSTPVTERIAISNSYYSYAAQTARLLDADLQVVAQCSQTIPTVHGFFPNLNKRSGSPKWDFENNQQDIVIINLGTNDEWQGTGLSNANYTAEKTLANIKSLLSDVREAYPNAYIIYVYGMMRKTYEPQYQQAINEMNDDKAFYIDMTEYKSTGGFDGNHPKRDSHTAVANTLADFIRENCSELFGHTTKTETMGALTSANKALFTDRTTASGTTRKMTYSNTGLTIEGYLYGDIKMNVNVVKDVCALNVIVDGDVANATTVWVEAGDKEVTLLTDLRRGNHTIEIVKGTAHHAGELTMKDITYTGTLITPTAKELQIQFIGDSVTVGEGIYGTKDPLAKSYNSIDGYASQVARYLGAGISTVAQCGAKIPGMTTQYNAATDGEKDIVVINLGTNDFGWSSLSGLDIANDYYPSGTTNIKIKDAITDLIDDVREQQPNAYIIWTYGMMFDLHLDALEGIITAYAEETNDDKLLFCDISAAKDNSGHGSHPSTMGNNYAALVLTGFIRQNCAELLSSVPTPEKTFSDGTLKVACVGDSITALGYWENNMRGLLSTDRYEVKGFGVSGSTALFKGVDYVNATTNAGKAYVDQSKYTQALNYNADIVIIMLGTNDSKKVNWPYFADEFVHDYVEIVRSFQNQPNAPMVFIGLPPTVYSTGSFQDISNSRIENFIIPALYEVAAQTGAVIVDTHTPTGGNSDLVSDGVHPTDAGKQILCETFAAAIKAKVEDLV